MALAKALSDVKDNKTPIVPDPARGTEGTGVSTNYFGVRGEPGLPHAVLLNFDPGRVSHPHYHGVDQFQVMVKGKGKMGRHDLDGYGVHFSRANTPYGPFIADPDVGLLCFNLHADTDPDWGSHHLPKEADNLKQIQNRKPFQITGQASFADIPSNDKVVMQPIPGVNDDYGLAAHALTMGAKAKFTAPDPATGAGQYLAVVEGSLIHDGRELKAPALVFVYPKDGPYRVQAGSAGLKAFVLNFPRQETATELAAKATPSKSGYKAWQCELCSFFYDEAVGMPDEGIPAGTRWADVPETWACPDCAASKSDFQMIEQKQH